MSKSSLFEVPSGSYDGFLSLLDILHLQWALRSYLISLLWAKPGLEKVKLFVEYLEADIPNELFELKERLSHLEIEPCYKLCWE